MQPIFKIFDDSHEPSMKVRITSTEVDTTVLNKVLRQAHDWSKSINAKLEDYTSYVKNYEVKSDKYALPLYADHHLLCNPSDIPLPSFELE